MGCLQRNRDLASLRRRSLPSCPGLFGCHGVGSRLFVSVSVHQLAVALSSGFLAKSDIACNLLVIILLFVDPSVGVFHCCGVALLEPSNITRPFAYTVVGVCRIKFHLLSAL